MFSIPLAPGVSSNINKIISIEIKEIKNYLWYEAKNMTTIKGMLDKVKSLDLRSEIPVIIQRTQSELILLNQTQLYQFGMKADGTYLKEYSNKYYAKKKNARNPQPGLGRPDFKDTGEFYKDFFVKADKSVFEVDSKDSKSADLIARDGENIFGLTDQNKTVYSLGVLYDGIKRYVTTKTGLSFS